MKPCPCGSGKDYSLCCYPFHSGTPAPDALALMRSRFAAYALNLPDYIIETTHPGSPQYQEDQAEWRAEITAFSRHTQFQKLEVLDFKEKKEIATVTFVAHLMQNKKDVTFTEKSYFDRVRGKWFYRIGMLAEGRAPNLITSGQVKMLPLAYYGNPILRKVAEPISEINEEVRHLVEEMIETMDGCDGIGLAAPQVRYSIRLFIIREPTVQEDGTVEWGAVKVFINPTLSDPSQETWKMEEGCLSIPTIRGEVVRPKEITLTYTTLEGEQVTERFSGLKARVIQHEYDHLQGVLFIDYLEEEEKQAIAPFLKRLDHRIHDGSEW